MSHGDKEYPGNQITDDEWKTLQNKPSTNAALNIAKNMMLQICFNVGETLICVERRSGKPITNYAGTTPQKFIVVYKDACGMVFCKKIISNGRLGKGIDIIATCDPRFHEFIQDPEAIDHILLGNEEDYDPFARQRALTNLRSRVNKHNNGFRLTFPTQTEAEAWMRNVNVGRRFWTGSDSDRDELEVVENPTMANGHRLVTLRLSDGARLTHNAYEFSSRYYRYYTERPRVFSEEVSNVS